jgi:hypothetical protein
MVSIYSNQQIYKIISKRSGIDVKKVHTIFKIIGQSVRKKVKARKSAVYPNFICYFDILNPPEKYCLDFSNHGRIIKYMQFLYFNDLIPEKITQYDLKKILLHQKMSNKLSDHTNNPEELP